MKRLHALSIAVAALALTFASVMPANASDDPQAAHLRSWYLSHGVSQQVTDQVVAKFASGQELDSMSASAQPVSFRTAVVKGVDETIATFADGSISETTLAARQAGPGKNQVSPMSSSVGPCASQSTYGGYTNYVDCNVGGDNGVVEVDFRADYTIGGDHGQITRVGSPYQYCFGCHANTPTLSIQRGVSSGNSPAQARAFTQYTGTARSGTAYLYLKVLASASASFTG